jgi:hypothetical protein
MKKIRLIATQAGKTVNSEFDLKRLSANLRIRLNAIRSEHAKTVAGYFEPDEQGASQFDQEIMPCLPFSLQTTIRTYLQSGMLADAVRLCATEVERILEDKRLAEIAEAVVVVPEDIAVDWAEQDVTELRRLDEFFR